MPEPQIPALPDLPTVERYLNGLNVDDLKWYGAAVARHLPTRKGDLVRLLHRVLTDPAQIRQLWEQCTAVQQRVVAEVVHTLAGRYDTDRVEAKCPGASAPTNPRRYDGFGIIFGSGPRKKEATPYDLLFAYSYDQGTFIPRDLVVLLKEIVPAPPPPAMRSQDEPPRLAETGNQQVPVPEIMMSATESAVVHDLAATLSLIHEGKVSVSASTRMPSLTTLRHLRPRLLLGDYFPDQEYERAEDAIRPLALIMLVQAAKWAAPGASSSKLELTKSGQALLGAQLGATHIREVWQRWLKSDLLDELSRVRAIKGQQSKGVRLTKPAERREKLLTVLRACPVGRWVEFDEFLRYMRAEGELPAVERIGSSGLAVAAYADFGWSGYGYPRYWDVVIGSYLRAVLWEYAATLGLIEIAYTRPEETPHDFGKLYGLDEYGGYLSRYDGLVGLRLTNLGAYVLGLTTEYTPPAVVSAEEAPLLQVLPNLDIVITDASRVTALERSFLERIGIPESQNVYRLSRDHVLEATQHGLSVEQITAFLAAKSGVAENELPQTVRVFFQDLQQRRGALRESGKLLLLEADDPYLLTELAHSSALRAMVKLATIDGRTVLLVPEDRETAVRRHLRKLGYAPQKS